MPLTYNGSDDNALALLCAAFGLPAPGNRATRVEILAAAAAGGVTITSNGSDRNAIGQLWDLLDAALVYALNATLPEVQALNPAWLLPTMSGNNLTGTITLDDVATTHMALPTGYPATNRRFSGTQAGNVALALTLPAATSGGSNPYAVTLQVANSVGAPIKALSINRKADGSLEYAIDGGAGVALGAAPASISIEVDGVGAIVCKVDAATVNTAAYVPGNLNVGMQMSKQTGLLTGVGSNVVATMSYTLPVVLP